MFLLLIFALLCINNTIKPELLILKIENNELAPLSKEDSLQYGDSISKILLKYEWPMCISASLTSEELDELCSENQPNAEETFIRKKIKQLNSNFIVLFIPTCVYELFCISYFFSNLQTNKDKDIIQENPFLQIASYISQKTKLERDSNAGRFLHINLQQILNKNISTINATLNDPDEYKYDYSTASLQSISKIVNSMFDRNNELFFSSKAQIFTDTSSSKKEYLFPGNNESAALFINNLIVTKLLERDSSSETLPTGAILSANINNKYEPFVSKIITDLDENLVNIYKSFLFIHKTLENTTGGGSLPIKKHIDKNIISVIIEQEYEARKLNKGLLIRGTKFRELNTNINESQPLISSTIHITKELGKEKTSDLLTAYGKNKINPYSISFGTSLFAGYVLDYGACAYTYLLENCSHGFRGYIIFINKKDYIEHQNNNLFYIPALAPITSLFQKGEYFHARAKVANPNKKINPGNKIEGIIGTLEDPQGFLLLNRNPLKHAQLFDDFLAKNGKLILPCGNEDQKAIEKLQKSPQEAAQFHGALHKIDQSPKVRKYQKKIKEQTAQKKTATTTASTNS